MMRVTTIVSEGTYLILTILISLKPRPVDRLKRIQHSTKKFVPNTDGKPYRLI